MPKIVMMASYGALIHGPLGNIVYKKLNRDIPDPTVKGVTKKVRLQFF